MNFDEWVIVAMPDNEETSSWVLQHEQCSYESDYIPDNQDRSVADILRWIENHQCPNK